MSTAIFTDYATTSTAEPRRYGPRQCRTGDLLGGARAPAGKQLPVLAPMLCRDGELKLSEEEATLLVGMSAATIDRRLAPERANMTLHGA